MVWIRALVPLVILCLLNGACAFTVQQVGFAFDMDGKLSITRSIVRHGQSYSLAHRSRSRVPTSLGLVSAKMEVKGDSVPAIAKPILAAKPVSINHARSLFDQYDMDGDGVIDAEELQNLADSLEIRNVEKTIFKEIDVDGDGRIDFSDFLKWYSTPPESLTDQGDTSRLLAALRKKSTRDNALAIFQRVDTDKSGVIDAGELQSLGGALGYKWSRSKAESILKSIAPAGATEVDFEAFFSWYEAAEATTSGSSVTAALGGGDAASAAAELRLAMRRDPSLDQRRVLIKGFPLKADEGAVKRFFTRAGAIDSVQILRWTRDGRPTGRCLITFAKKEGADGARRLHRHLMGPRFLEVYRVNCGDAEERVPLATSLHGAVLGVGGRNIKRIEAESGARLFLQANGTEGRLVIKGTEEERRVAKDKVKNTVESDSVLRIPIETSMAGLIIGAGGRTRAKIERQSGARLQVKEDGAAGSVYTRAVVELRGGAAATAVAYGLLMDELEAAGEDRRLLHSKFHGSLMGRKGATVSAIENETATRIRFLRPDPAAPAAGGGEDGGVVVIRGPPAARLRAWELLLGVRDHLPRVLAVLRGGPLAPGALRSRPELAGPVDPEQVWPLAVAEALYAAKGAAEIASVQL